MATTDAIAVTTEALRALLEASCPVSDFPGLVVQACRPQELQERGAQAVQVTVCLYRSQRNAHRQSELPPQENSPVRIGVGLDLHYLITAWGRDLAEEQRLLGCLVVALERSPVLTGDPLRQAAGRLPGCDADGFRSGDSLRMTPREFAETERVVLAQAGSHLEAHSLLVSVSVVMGG